MRSSFAQPHHTNYHTTARSAHFATPCDPFFAPSVQPLSLPAPRPEPLQYAIPVVHPEPSDAVLVVSPSTLDYLRPQTWRNLPQQQQRASTDVGIARVHSAVHVRTDSDTAMAANAATASTATTATATTGTATTATATTGTGAVCSALEDRPEVVLLSCATSATASAAASPSTSAADGASQRSVDTAVETMWEARRRREEAEEEADRKLLDAVCKASLVEYNGRERALETFASETSQQTRAHETSSVALQRAKGEAEQRKHAAMQVVIDSKARAKHMSEKARDATSLYEQKATERLVKQAELDALKLREAQAAEMRAMQERTQAAVLKRAEAEQKAREARDKAEAMRCRAFQAASTLRANSRRQIETRLSHEEAQRQQEMQRKLDEIERAKAAAHERREAAAKKAADARRRADELRLRAEQARAGLMKHATAAAPPSRA